MVVPVTDAEQPDATVSPSSGFGQLGKITVKASSVTAMIG
jgi:hypothetical protein